MSALRDEVRKLAAAVRRELGAIVDPQYPEHILEAAFASPDQAEASVEALEAGESAIGEDGPTQIVAQQLCAAVLRDLAEALGVKE